MEKSYEIFNFVVPVKHINDREVHTDPVDMAYRIGRTDFQGTFELHEFPIIGKYPFKVPSSLPLPGTETH